MEGRPENPALETVEDRSPPPAAVAFDHASIGGFLIEGEAGRGGMGVVYRAREPSLDRRVALKIMAPGLSSDARFRQLFEEESRRAAALEHPNVLPVYRSGEESGRLYIAMRFVEDGSLQDLIERRGRLPLGMTVRIVGRVADALDAAHGHGLVHRDVKPGNILVADPGGDEEQVYLSDFGLAMPVEQARRGGAAGGTPGYLSPEQLAGGAVGPWTDVYALGLRAPLRADRAAAVPGPPRRERRGRGTRPGGPARGPLGGRRARDGAASRGPLRVGRRARAGRRRRAPGRRARAPRRTTAPRPAGWRSGCARRASTPASRTAPATTSPPRAPASSSSAAPASTGGRATRCRRRAR